MPSVEHAAILDTDADRVWSIVKRFGAIADWHPEIAEGRIDGDIPDGTPGCVRVLRLADGGTLRERLLAIDDANRSLTYRFDAAPLPVDDYRLTVALVPITGEPRSFIRWTARFDVRPGHDPAEQVAVIRGLVAGGHDALGQFLTQKAVA
ncbi:SRPBCC family protein [Sphingomonas sp. RB3P16]|uniref:SRPBCC family protein n=1 Tax=Parasphingomonas frigoris TaxID=3096163 RepID=UPI002FC59C7E